MVTFISAFKDWANIFQSLHLMTISFLVSWFQLVAFSCVLQTIPDQVCESGILKIAWPGIGQGKRRAKGPQALREEKSWDVENHLNQQATTEKFYLYFQHLLTTVGLFSTQANKIVERYAISSCCSRGEVHQPWLRRRQRGLSRRSTSDPCSTLTSRSLSWQMRTTQLRLMS